MMSGFCAAMARVSSSVLGSSWRTFGLLELARRLADHPLVEGARAGEVGLGLLDVGPRARQAGLGLGDVGARHFADLEPVTGRLQLALQPLLVVQREVEHRLVAIGRRVGVDGVEQDLLLERVEAGALGADLVLRLADLRLRAAAGVEVLAQGQIDALGRCDSARTTSTLADRPRSRR